MLTCIDDMPMSPPTCPPAAPTADTTPAPLLDGALSGNEPPTAPALNPSPLEGYRDALLAEAEPAADLPSRSSSGDKNHDSGKESVTAVTCYRYATPVTGGNSRGNSDEALPVTPLPNVTVTLGNGQLSGNDQHGGPDTTGTAGTTGTTGTAATGATAVGDDAPQGPAATEQKSPLLNPSPLNGYRDALLAEAEPAADLPSRRSEPSNTPLPRPVATAYWWILTDGSRIGRRFAEPVPLTVATATGRKLHGDAFSHAEPQEIPL